MDYTAFQDSAAYGSSPSGAQFAAQITDQKDPNNKFVGLLTFSVNFNNELVPIREGGESMPREIARGAGDISGQMSMVFTSKRADHFMPSESTFLNRGPYTVEIYDGEPWGETAGTVRFALTDLYVQNFSLSVATQGGVELNLAYMATRLWPGAEYAALTSS